MILAESTEATTAMFPARVLEPCEPMTPEESAAFSRWQESPTAGALYAALADHVADALGLEAGAILSVGEGEGLLASCLAERCPRASVEGVDVCPEVVRRARARHARSNLTYEQASVYALDRPGAFDAVVCVFSLHHFERAEDALRQMLLALRPGGRLYVMDLRRDANAGAYFRRLDWYVDLGALEMARLFRQSVRAAHTTQELTALLERRSVDALIGERERVSRVDLGERARRVYRSLDPAADLVLPDLLLDIDGLWLEALVTRREAHPSERGSVASATRSSRSPEPAPV